MSSMKLITVAVAALFLLVVSAILRFGELYIMSAAVACLPIASYIVGRYSVKNLRCTREAPEYAREDEPISIIIRVHGNSGMLGPMEVHDVLPEFFSMNEERLSQNQETDDASVTYTASANNRGDFTLGPLKVRVSDPLGFFMFTCEYPLFNRMVVLPKPLEVAELRTGGAGSFGEYQYEGSGVRGGGTDFHGVREYQHGDELRRVHWPSTARHGRLNVIEFEHRRAQDTIIAIDLSRDSEVHPGRYSSLEYSIRIAAGIAERAIGMGSAARLLCSGVEGQSSFSATGLHQLYAILDSLARLKADHSESLSDLLTSRMDTVARDSEVICISSKIDKNLSAVAQMLSPKGVELHMVALDIGEGIGRQDDLLDSRLLVSGMRVTVVECSAKSIEGRVKYDYST